MLDSALWVMSIAETMGGTPRRAARYIEQVRELRRAIGFDAEHVINVSLLAWQDVPRDQVVAMADGAGADGVRRRPVRRDDGRGHGRPGPLRLRAGARDLRPLVDEPFLHVGPLGYPDFIEAAVRTDRREEALVTLAALEDRAALNGSPWAMGVTERSRALVTDDDSAEGTSPRDHPPHRDPAEVELARAHLLYGEWLRRVRRRRDAREQLRIAADLFQRTGADVFLPRVTTRSRPPAATRSQRSPTTSASRRRSPRSRPWPRRATPTPRSAPPCSSVPTPSTTTCARCSRSSASPPADSSPTGSNAPEPH